MIGADGKEQRPQGKNQTESGHKTVENSQQLHRKKEKRGTKAVSGIETVEKKWWPWEIFRKVVTANGPRPLKRSDNPDVIYGKGF